MRSKKLRTLIGALFAVLALVALSACGNAPNNSTSTDKCGFVVGDGQDGHDAKIHDVVYPGQTFHVSDWQNVLYFPCNSRDYYINQGNQKNANGNVIADRTSLSPGETSNGTKVWVAVNAYFTPNQDKNVLKTYFWPLCQKFTCASDTTASGDVNSSTPGWNNMLGEVMGQGIDQDMEQSTSVITDAAWQKNDRTQWQNLDKALAANFDANARQVYGSNANLFCGSGNSNWTNPANPGHGSFTCTNVRFIVTGVWPQDSSLLNSNNAVSAEQAQKDAYRKKVAILASEYGSVALAERVLALQAICGGHCVLNPSTLSSTLGQ